MSINNKKVVIHILFSMRRGGTERYVVDLVKNTSDKYKNIILYFDGENEWSDELSGVGIIKCKNKLSEIMKIIRDNKVDISYIYMFYGSARPLVASLIAGVRKRIVHSHRVEPVKKINSIKRVLQKTTIKMLATEKLACSEGAGKSLFGRSRYTVIKNGIDLSLYQFDASKRREFRYRMGFKDADMVIGCIGRIDKNKNQSLLVDIISDLNKNKRKYKLVIIGDGDERKALESRVKSLRLESDIFFLGSIRDTQCYYNVFDVIAIPSIKEGFPYVALEAQANGVQVLLSDTISKKCAINDNVRRISIDNGICEWVKIIKGIQRGRIKPNSAMESYSIRRTTRQIEGIYEK